MDVLLYFISWFLFRFLLYIHSSFLQQVLHFGPRQTADSRGRSESVSAHLRGFPIEIMNWGKTHWHGFSLSLSFSGHSDDKSLSLLSVGLFFWKSLFQWKHSSRIFWDVLKVIICSIYNPFLVYSLGTSSINYIELIEKNSILQRGGGGVLLPMPWNKEVFQIEHDPLPFSFSSTPPTHRSSHFWCFLSLVTSQQSFSGFRKKQIRLLCVVVNLQLFHSFSFSITCHFNTIVFCGTSILHYFYVFRFVFANLNLKITFRFEVNSSFLMFYNFDHWRLSVFYMWNFNTNQHTHQ